MVPAGMQKYGITSPSHVLSSWKGLSPSGSPLSCSRVELLMDGRRGSGCSRMSEGISPSSAGSDSALLSSRCGLFRPELNVPSADT